MKGEKAGGWRIPPAVELGRFPVFSTFDDLILHAGIKAGKVG